MAPKMAPLPLLVPSQRCFLLLGLKGNDRLLLWTLVFPTFSLCHEVFLSSSAIDLVRGLCPAKGWGVSFYQPSSAQFLTEEFLKNVLSPCPNPMYITPSWSLGNKTNLGIMSNWTFWVKTVSPTKAAKVFSVLFLGQHSFSPVLFSVHRR